MKQSVLTPKQVCLLLSKGHSCFRARWVGERKRKSICGCIVAADIAALPKRATKIRRFSNLTKEYNVRKFVVCCEVKSAKNPDAKPYTKAPKIQQLVTPEVVAKRQMERKAKLAAVKLQKYAAAAAQH
ncbi:hypothetical protein PCASD_08192 [Puccinia coronata f. sp. avenae]|uniref:Uncharacterized protein n=1 Tax=Puccinia coronata f. sp. avenae TaxID=200324 RepID=A0A2N5VC35_9BASI|nr:hypothetical protein PCASD_08192 [Puccinia coronata f. sp. avenae]